MIEKVELMIRKKGSQWCLYTHDGSRELGCHDSEAGAIAQEAAVKANMESRTGAVRFDLAEIDVSEGSYSTLDNGNVVKWIPLAEDGEHWVNGPFEFDITKELVAQGIKNFEARGKQPLPVTFGHLEDSAAPAGAWINDIRLGPPEGVGDRKDPRPWGQVEFLKDSWDSIPRGEYKYFSLEFYPESVDGKGNDIGFEFDGGAILNKPFFPSLRIDQAAQRGAPCYRLSRFTNASHLPGGSPGQGDRNMTTPAAAPATPAAAAGAAPAAEAVRAQDIRIEGDRVTLNRQQFDTLMKSHKEAEGLRGQVATLQADKESTEARVVKLERHGVADKIRAAVRHLQSEGFIVQLGDFVLKSDEDCFAWLATLPFGVSTADGLEKLAEDTELNAHLPRVRLGGEKAGGTDRVAPVDLSTEAGRNEAVRRCEAELRKKYTKEELETQLRRRGGDITALARELVAADHPTYRNQLMEKK